MKNTVIVDTCGETEGLDGPSPARRTDLVIHELDGEALIYDPQRADTHRLNETALRVWTQLNGMRSLKEITGDLVEAYDVNADDASAHVRRIIQEFQQKHLTIGVEPAGNA